MSKRQYLHQVMICISIKRLKQYAKSGLMENINKSSGGFNNQEIRRVVLLLLKAEAVLMSKMKSKKEHPDAAFTIQLKESNLQIRSLLNLIMEDELKFLHAERYGIVQSDSLSDRMEKVAAQAQNLLLFVESFQFVSIWIHECLKKIKALSSYYSDDME